MNSFEPKYFMEFSNISVFQMYCISGDIFKYNHMMVSSLEPHDRHFQQLSQVVLGISELDFEAKK